jgi:gamma-glutamylcyclotransferase (GGCT)/AIG2-like uncharacterized protein YtfP
LITSFKTVVNGFDKFSVNSYIYDMETQFIADMDELERKRREQETELLTKQEKINSMEAKLEKLINLQKYIDNAEKIIEITKFKIFDEKQKSIDEINEYYDKKNQKRENDINILEEDIEKSKKTFSDIMGKVYSSLNKAFDVKLSDRRNLIEQEEDDSYNQKEDTSYDSEESIIGKVIQNNIEDDEGNIILSKGDTVNDEVIDWAKQNDKILELLASVG